MKRMILVTINVLALFLIAGAAHAQVADAGGSNQTAIYLGMASAFAIAIAAVGGAIAQGRAAASALEGIARNPEAAGKVMTPMIIALALIESLVIYALVIAFLLQAKI